EIVAYLTPGNERENGSEPLRYEVLRGNAPERPRRTAQHDTLGIDVAALATNAGDELAIRHTRRDEDRVLSRHEFVGVVDVIHLEARIDPALAFYVISRCEPALNVSAESLDGTRRHDPLGAPADTHAHIS